MKLNHVFIVLLIAIIIGCDPKNGSPPKVNWLASVDSLIQVEYEQGRFDGSLTIGTRDNILYHKAIGIANRNWNTPIETNTRFDIASLNKSFQAALVLIAAEEKKLTLTDRLVDHLPDPGFDSTITLHHLLTHTSGLPDYDAIHDSLKTNNYRAFKRMHFNNDDYVHFIANLKPVGKPGQQFHYSNFAYHLLPVVLENLYQQDFDQVLQEKICAPFGLKHTFSETDNQQVHTNIAAAYSYDSEQQRFTKNNFIDLTLGRRIFSTSGDLYLWSKLLCEGKILSPASYQLMTTNHIKSIQPDISYGYGFVVFDGGNYRMGNLSRNQKYLIHGGATEGYKAMLTNINNGELIVTHLSNIGNQTNEMQLTQKLINLILQ